MLQLVYMWIEDFRILKNVNLNFHSNFEFEFEKSNIDENKGKLKIREFNSNDDFIYKYFSENQFISLILGKNGTGKTSILELLESLKENQRYISEASFDQKGVSKVYKLKGRFFCIFFNRKKNKLLFWGAITEEKEEKIILLDDLQKNSELPLKLPPIKIDNEKEKIKLNHTYFSLPDKLSVTYLLSKEFKEWYQKPLGNSWGEEFKSNYLKDNHSFLRNLFKCGNINIISGILPIDKYTKFPDYFIIKIFYERLTKDGKDYSFEDFLREIKNSKLPDSKKTRIENSLKKLKTLHEISLAKELEPILKIKIILFFHAFLRYINNMVGVYEGWKDFIESEEFEKLFEKLEIIGNLEKKYGEVEDLIKDLYEHYKNIELKIDNLTYSSGINESLENIELFLSSLEKLLKDKEKVEQKEANSKISVKIEIDKSKNDSSFLKKIVDLVDKYLALKLYEFNPIKLDFYPPLSSGQKALLSVFADISEVLDGENCSQKDTEENFILLLDEPDVYFHPEWQRLFIYFLTEFLKKKYSNKDFHVIISTHSPFMLSDIPKGNCVFLDLYVKENENGKVEEYRTIVKPKEKIHDTLAQNIYYLLADSFFMEKSIGEYIRLKLIDMFDNPKRDFSFFEKLVSKIGDEIYKKRFEIHLEKIKRSMK